MKHLLIAAVGAAVATFIMETAMNTIAHHLESETKSALGCRPHYRSITSMQGYCR